MTSERDVETHAATIRALSAPGAPLSAESPHATIANPAWFITAGRIIAPTPLRRRLHQQVLAPYRDRLAEVAHDRRAIVLAGPPGAGKSRILADVVGPEGSAGRRAWLEVDPDEIKKALLDAAADDGSYETFIKPPAVLELEEAGEKFFPLDFAALVHEESSALAKTIRSEAISSGANIVIDSVLSKPDAAVELGRELAQAGYQVEVIDVEVPYEVSAARIAERWRSSYLKALDGQDRHGGRWVPESYARSVYGADPGARSIAQQSADRLATECPNVTRLRRYWTPSISAPRVLERDVARAPGTGALIDRSALTAAKAHDATYPKRSTPRRPGPGLER